MGAMLPGVRTDIAAGQLEGLKHLLSLRCASAAGQVTEMQIAEQQIHAAALLLGHRRHSRSAMSSVGSVMALSTGSYENA